MASHGVFVSLCGFEHHGPKGHLGFAPRITPEDFRAPFITAEGWGTFSQKRTGDSQSESLALKSGTLTLKTLAFDLPADAHAAEVLVRHGDAAVPALFTMQQNRVTLTLRRPVTLGACETLSVEIGFPN